MDFIATDTFGAPHSRNASARSSGHDNPSSIAFDAWLSSSERRRGWSAIPPNWLSCRMASALTEGRAVSADVPTIRSQSNHKAKRRSHAVRRTHLFCFAQFFSGGGDHMRVGRVATWLRAGESASSAAV